MKLRKRGVPLIAVVMGLMGLLVLGLVETGCGTTVGNPATVTLKSTSYNNTGVVSNVKFPASLLAALINTLSPIANAAPVTELKFCSTKIQLESGDESPISGTAEGILGIIDLSDSTVATTWGNIQVTPEGATFQKLDIELHVDTENCPGATYSVRYEGQELTKDLEFEFRFAQPINIQDNDVLAMGMTAIATALENARAAGQFNDLQIANYLTTTTEGTGQKE